MSKRKTAEKFVKERLGDDRYLDDLKCKAFCDENGEQRVFYVMRENVETSYWIEAIAVGSTEDEVKKAVVEAAEWRNDKGIQMDFIKLKDYDNIDITEFDGHYVGLFDSGKMCYDVVEMVEAYEHLHG